MKQKNDFNSVAFIYDLLAILVFGKTIVRAQKYFLNHINVTDSVLILGGGTGKAFKDLVRNNPTLTITYIDASASMLKLAKKNLGESNTSISFICGTENDIPNQLFQTVIGNFYFDLFSEGYLLQLLRKIRSHQTKNGKLIVTDFRHTNSWWQRSLLFIMYRFFGMTTNIEAKRLPDWQRALEKSGFVSKANKYFYRGFIETRLCGLSQC